LENAIGDMNDGLAVEAKLQNEVSEGADFMEGYNAFREKRKPQFRGM